MMSQKFIQLTSGWIPVAVLLMFAVVLINSQASANLPADIRAVPAKAEAISKKLVLLHELTAEADAGDFMLPVTRKQELIDD